MWNEALCSFYGSWVSLLLFLVIIAFNTLLNNDYQKQSIIQSIIIFISILFVWYLVFPSKIYTFYKYPSNRNTIENQQESNETTYISDLAKSPTPTPKNDIVSPVPTISSIATNTSGENNMFHSNNRTNNANHNHNKKTKLDIDKWVGLLSKGIDETEVIAKMTKDGISDAQINAFFQIYYQARNETLNH